MIEQSEIDILTCSKITPSVNTENELEMNLSARRQEPTQSLLFKRMMQYNQTQEIPIHKQYMADFMQMRRNTASSRILNGENVSN